MSRLKPALVGLLALAAMVLIIPGTALAAPAHHGNGHKHHHAKGHALVYGTVGTTGTTSFDVTTPKGTVTVNYTSKTKFVPHSTAAGSTIASGDAVLAVGKFRNGFVARRVVFDTTAFAVPGRNRSFVGTWASNTTSTLTISNQKGVSRTFSTDSNTKYRENGKKVTTPTYATGDRVGVVAQKYTDSTWHAKLVVIKTPKHHKK